MISIIRKPQKFQPAGNATIFQIQSNLNNVVYFLIEVKDFETDTVISALEIYVTPNYSNGSYIDLSRIISNVVKWEVNNSQNLLSIPITKSFAKYKITITEKGINATTGKMESLSTAVTLPDVFSVWNSKIDRFRFNNFIYTDYILTTGVPSKFLTYKPNNSTVNDFSSEQLYFIHEDLPVLKAVIKTYNNSNVLLNTYSEGISDLATSNIFRLQVSPKSLKESLLVDFIDVNYYTVYLEDENGNRKTEIRTYLYTNVPCNIEPQNIFWVNSLGGIDTYQFLNVIEKNNIVRNTIKKNPYQIIDGYYTDRRNEVINPSEEIVDITQSGNYQAFTGVITDAESKWLNELFISEQAFVELADNGLIPIIITDENYQIQKQRLNKSGFNSTQVNYKLDGELIPTEASAYTTGFGTGKIELDFIDNQMEDIA